MYISPTVAATVLSPTRDKTTIILPDMFQTFLKEEPRVNPLYAQVKPESEEWLNRLVSQFLFHPLRACIRANQSADFVPSHQR